MATIAENLQTLLDQKAAIKAALENKGKAPTEELGTYAGLIDTLENEEQISYVLTNADGSARAYAVKSAEEAITLTATENDIRLNTTAITNIGYTEGQKDIPAYHTQTGKKLVLAGAPVEITLEDYDFLHMHAMLCEYDTSIINSVLVYANVVEGVVYEANTANKLADITVDGDTKTISLGITADKKSVLRYFLIRKEL